MNLFGRQVIGSLWKHRRQAATTFFTNAVRTSVVLPASRFRHILDDVGITPLAYGDDPLAQLSPCMRGNVLEMVARSTCAELLPHAITCDAEPRPSKASGQQCKYHARCDWMSDGRRIECKSAQLTYWSSGRTWKAQFCGIKLPVPGFRETAMFDDLILVLHTPYKLSIIHHDLALGLTTSGQQTLVCGHHVVLRGRRNECWRLSRGSILDKFRSCSNSCKLLAELDVQDVKVSKALAHFLAKGAAVIMTEAYKNTPLIHANTSLRGNRLQSIACDVDHILNPSSLFTLAGEDLRSCGRRRGANQGKFDWCRDGRRIEFKSSQVQWQDKAKRWICHFRHVKFAIAGMPADANFDDLWLGIYSPFGLHIFRHCGTFGVSRSGIRTDVLGSSLLLRAPSGQQDMSSALDIMFTKLELAGCQHLATVLW
ncbi:unnamed protein product [Polarella glacialis]|uniref:Uncharacterized protein n=1 Tax=Polarella glacialis TaxID=89957 RepID=A0A813DNZ2_POLGL|nr:unnamed protein product [Polarella glacialis]